LFLFESTLAPVINIATSYTSPSRTPVTQRNKANRVPRPAHSAQPARYVIRSLPGPYQPFTDFLAMEFPRQASLDISFSGPELLSPKALFAHKQPTDALNWSSSTDPYLHPGILMYALYTPNAYCPSPPSPFVRSFVRGLSQPHTLWFQSPDLN
jgi:hypothetical protein